MTELAPYISTGFSGLTFAQGVDIGDQGNFTSLENLTAYSGITFASVLTQLFPEWQSDPNLTYIAQFAGETHAQALTTLHQKANQIVGGNPTSLAVSLTEFSGKRADRVH